MNNEKRTATTGRNTKAEKIASRKGVPIEHATAAVEATGGGEEAEKAAAASKTLNLDRGSG